MNKLWPALLVSLGTQASAKTPPLTVLIVVDQLQGDEIQNYSDLWQHGFKRLRDEGRWYDQAQHGHGRTETAAGHACIATGVLPRFNGIVDKKIYDKNTQSLKGVCQFGQGPCDPNVVLSPTLGDRFKEASPQSLVVALSQKDRSAMLLGGKNADLVAWYDNNNFGALVGRSGGKPEVPAWLQEKFSALTALEKLPKTWELPPLPARYRERLDDNTYEKDEGAGIVFPHHFPDPGKNRGLYFDTWQSSPFGDQLLLELVFSALDTLKLGRDEVPDLLMVSFSSVDLVGHAFGPDSLERAAILSSMDHILGRLFEGIEKRVGKNNFVVGLTADHGISSIAEIAKERGEDAGRLDGLDLVVAIETAAHKALGQNDGVAKLASLKEQVQASKVIQAFAPPYIWLKKEANTQAVQKAVINSLNSYPHVYRAWPTARLAGEKDAVAKLLFANSHPERSGDLSFALQPRWFLNTVKASEWVPCEHGAPWHYDLHVPIFMWGEGIKAGRVQKPVAVIDLTRTLSDRLGLKVLPNGGRPLP